MAHKPFTNYWAMPRPMGQYKTRHPDSIFQRISNDIWFISDNDNTLHLFSGISDFGKVKIDINIEVNVDYYLDLSKDRIPFEDNTFDLIYADPPYYDFKPYCFIDEAVRVLKPKCLLFILHQLVYKTPKNTTRQDLIPITTGPNMRMRCLNVFKKEILL